MQKTLVVQKLRQGYSLEILLSFTQLPRATFYYQLDRMKKSDKYKAAKEEITAICNNHRIKEKLKGLPPAIHRQQALSAA